MKFFSWILIAICILCAESASANPAVNVAEKIAENIDSAMAQGNAMGMETIRRIMKAHDIKQNDFMELNRIAETMWSPVPKVWTEMIGRRMTSGGECSTPIWLFSQFGVDNMDDLGKWVSNQAETASVCVQANAYMWVRFGLNYCSCQTTNFKYERTFSVSVTCDLPKAIQEGKINRVDLNGIAHIKFPEPGCIDGKAEIILKDFDNRKITHSEVLAELSKLGLRSATMAELLELGIQHPNSLPRLKRIASISAGHCREDGFGAFPAIDAETFTGKDKILPGEFVGYEPFSANHIFFAAVRK